jgi:cytochrome c553
MSAIAQSLTPQQYADVSAYFASLPGLPENSGERTPRPNSSYRNRDPVQRLIYAGDPKRGIAACASCHGPGGYRIGAPALAKQNELYLEQQLQAFAQGTRANDMDMQMRTIAGRAYRLGDASAGAGICKRKRHGTIRKKSENTSFYARGREEPHIAKLVGCSLAVCLLLFSASTKSGKIPVGMELVAAGTPYSPGILAGDTLYVAALQGTDPKTQHCDPTSARRPGTV